MHSEQLHTGRVIKIIKNNYGKIETVLIKKENGEEYLLPGQEIGIRLHSRIKEGHHLDFVILHNNIVSIKKALPLKREIVLDKLNSDEGSTGIIKDIYSWGAHISIDGYICIMENADFSQDHTTIGCVYKEGDILSSLKLVRITSNGFIHVAPEVKYKCDINLDSSLIKKGTKVFGIVKNIKKFDNKDELYCFVGVPSKIQLLAKMPNFEVKEDDMVICQVKKIDEESGVLRGKILQVKYVEGM